MSVAITSVLQMSRYVPELKTYRMVVTFDSSYPTGGEIVDVSQYLQKVRAVIPLGLSTTGYVIAVNPASLDLGFFILKAWYGNYDSADGPLIEVPNATNLSAESVTILVIGPDLGG